MCLRSAQGLVTISREVHQVVDSPLGGVGASCSGDRQMKEKSRNGLVERPRCWTDDARLLVLLERKSAPTPGRVVTEEDEEGTGLETTRASGIDGGRMVDTEPPREREDWEGCIDGLDEI